MTESTPLLGVIEGFYGRAYSASSRMDLVGWLKRLGLDAYLYAPKSDPYLRRRWRDAWTEEARAPLKRLSERCDAIKLGFYVGLSPFAIYQNYDAAAQLALRTRVVQLADLGIQGIGLLFDDMPGACDALAARQADIAGDVLRWCGGLPLIVCPTYYSDDPVLDRVFGARPERYLETLGALLEPTVSLFWTGPEVCSAHVSVESLEVVQRRAACPLALWDNYPVNDSRQRSEHLYLQPLEGRYGAAASLLDSHWCNAMNQSALSLPALASLPALYGRPAPEQSTVFAEAGLTDQLRRALDVLAVQRYSDLDPASREALLALAQSDTPATRELLDWLRGGYKFDPACLTD